MTLRKEVRSSTMCLQTDVGLTSGSHSSVCQTHGKMRYEYKICLQTLRERDHSEYLDVDGKLIHKLILRTVLKLWTGFMWLTIGNVDEILLTW
jgi:hypothetical protein